MQKDFKTLTSTFINTIHTWDYFVNWNKIYLNSSGLEITLNKLNYLLGKENLEIEFAKLYKSNPDIVSALPILLAVRENKIEIYDKLLKTTEIFNFLNLDTNPSKYYKFIEKSGLYSLFKTEGIKNLVDYVTGVEVGLDTNARKNRGGKLMEKIVEVYIKKFCDSKEFEYIAQANSKQIKNKWNVDVNVNKSSRNFDFAIFNPQNNKIKLIETNFFFDGGSKLKSVCGEFKTLQSELRGQGIEFIWITDGKGWSKTLRPLEEIYEHNDFIVNLNMLENNVLDNLIW